MPGHPFLSDASKAQLVQAARSVEAESSAEVVIAVQPWSSAYREVAHLFGAILALAGLLFMLFSEDYEFELGQIAMLTVAFYLMGFLLSAGIPVIRRLLTLPSAIRRDVDLAAKTKFFDLGVSRTTGRTGILVYVSLLEHRCRVLADTGVLRAVPPPEWQEALGKIERSVQVSGTGNRGVEALCQAISRMTPVLALYLPRLADDVNELAEMVEEPR